MVNGEQVRAFAKSQNGRWFLLFTIYPSLFTLKNWFALVDVSVQSFFGVLRLEELLLQFAFERECGFERNLGARLHAALNSADCASRLVRQSKLRRVFCHLLSKLFRCLRVKDLIEQTQLESAFEIE